MKPDKIDNHLIFLEDRFRWRSILDLKSFCNYFASTDSESKIC